MLRGSLPLVVRGISKATLVRVQLGWDNTKMAGPETSCESGLPARSEPASSRNCTSTVRIDSDMIAERDWTCIANCPLPLVCSTEVGFAEVKSGFSTYCVVHHSLPIPSFASGDSGTLRGVKLLAVECTRRWSNCPRAFRIRLSVVQMSCPA